MQREFAYEGMKVRIVNRSGEQTGYDGQTGTIIQIWPIPEYKWYAWATVEHGEDNQYCTHILYDDLEGIYK